MNSSSRRRRRVLVLVAVPMAITAAILAWTGYLYWPMHAFDDPQAEQVVLLHGLGRSASSMRLLERRLTRAGFEVISIEYPSTSSGPAALIDRVGTAIEGCCADNGRPLHLVGHSLGGLLIRRYLQDRRPANLGRVVLVGTPNAGSVWIDLLGEVEWFRRLAGETALELGTDSKLLRGLEPPDYPVGVIAGNQSVGALERNVFGGENDGLVSVESTILAGMTDHIVIDTNHGFMRWDAEVACQIVAFLRDGAFDRSPDSSCAG